MSTSEAIIRTDQTSVIVEVRLANVGEAAYKPEVYGRSVRNERWLTNTSSSYSIMGDKGKVFVGFLLKLCDERFLVKRVSF